MSNVPMTPEGKEALAAELTHLKLTVRLAIIQDIEEARAHGDISENSEYEDAKERQALNEGRIQDIESKLSRAQVIDVTQLPGVELDADDEEKVVVFGSTVHLEDDEESELVYRIVGSDESSVASGKISYESPIARALMGKAPGDEVVVQTPKGKRTLEIIEVHYS